MFDSGYQKKPRRLDVLEHMRNVCYPGRIIWVMEGYFYKSSSISATFMSSRFIYGAALTPEYLVPSKCYQFFLSCFLAFFTPYNIGSIPGGQEFYNPVHVKMKTYNVKVKSGQ